MAALRYLPLAEANVIGFASPLLLTALAYPVLGERVGLRRWLAVIVGFAGVLAVIRATPPCSIGRRCCPSQWLSALPPTTS